MLSLLTPALASDPRSQIVDTLSQQLEDLNRAAVLVNLVDIVPAEALPFLAKQFNVIGPLWKYLRDEAAQRRAIKQSVAWHRAKGTPWAVETALSWAGFTATVDDLSSSAKRWAEYQLELATPVDASFVPEIVTLASFAAPVRAKTHLVRLYSGYDRRVLKLDSSYMDVALLDDDSGVLVDGVKVSFGTSVAVASEQIDGTVRVGAINTYSTRVWDDNSWRLDAWALDSDIQIDGVGGIVSQLSTTIAQENDPEIAFICISSMSAVVVLEANPAAIGRRMDDYVRVAPSDVRGWTGRWTGAWRESIPTRFTEES